MYKRILVATDGSVLAGRALEHAVELAKALKAHLSIVTVTAPASAYACSSDFEAVAIDCARKIDRAADEVLEAADVLVKSNGLECETIKVRSGQPYRAIVQAAQDEQADLIVMASHCRHRLPAAIIGGETINVLTHSNIPVLVYREERPVPARTNLSA